MAFDINKFLIGKQSFRTVTERKQSILLGQMAFVAMGICLIYLIADPLNQLYSFLQWYSFGVILSIVVLILNRSGHYLTSASVLMVTSIVILFVIAFIGNPNRGVYFYFVSASVTSFVFFYNRSLILAAIFVSLCMIAAMAGYLIESPIQETVPTTKEALQFRYLMNLLISTLSAVIVIIFMIRRNAESESSLIESNGQLEKLSNNLETSKTRFERALAGTKAGIYEWNVLEDSVFVSNRWKQLLGYAGDNELDVDMQFFREIVHPDDIERTSKNMEVGMASGGNYQNELRMRLTNGSYRWFLDSGIITLKDGLPTQAVGSIIDINDRKKAESALVNKNEELQKANDELDRFVYSASHDMRAPLSTLLGLIEVIKLNDDPKEYQRYFDMMTSRINDMEGFITEVTDYSRNTRLAVNRKPVNLLALVEKIKESFFTLANQSKVKIQIEIADNLIISTDETRLKVVLNNLLANAIKYNNAEDNRRVKISARSNPGSCSIEIKDNGRGIAKEFQPKIFDMFYRASDDSSGSGLGLYIVKETLDKLDGEISFSSEVRKGTIFTVTLSQNS